MLPRILRRPQAEADLFEIWDYIAQDHEAAADQFLDRLEEKLHKLAANPELGRERPELYPNLRSLSVANYVIFYLPLEHGIDIIRVLHGARDIPVVLGQ